MTTCIAAGAWGRVPSRQRRQRGQINHAAGEAAEEIVARLYGLSGHAVLAQRWRGRSGEIDLVLRDGDGVICVEVKKSRTCEAALARVTAAQARRVMRAATEFIGTMPKGQLTDMRFDIAAVDSSGHVEITQNAFWGLA